MQEAQDAPVLDLLGGRALRAERDRERSAEIASHRHPHGECCLITRGHLSAKSDQARWLIPSGQAYWVPPDTPHGGELVGCSAIRIHVAADMARAHAPSTPIAFSATPLVAALLERWADRIGDGADRTPIDDHFLAILADEMMRAVARPVLLPMPQHPAIRRVMSLWAVTCEERASLDVLAERCAMSRRSFTRLFREQTGRSPGAWMQTARILEGCHLMASGVSVTETAIRLGYDSVSSFFNLCRRATGQNPTTLSRHLALNPPR